MCFDFNADSPHRSPESITLKPITKSDVVMAAKRWHIRAEQIKYLQILRKFNPTVGAYNSDGQMAAWIFRFATLSNHKLILSSYAVFPSLVQTS